ncbi:MAG: hypothetical protein JW931_02555 [Methanomicrobiaceae archaeon]|nr:hypothetical protein [Methanomicrobiaceae archaeon]
MVWKIYTYTEIKSAADPDLNENIVVIAEDGAGERIVARVEPSYDGEISINLEGEIEAVDDPKGRLFYFIPKNN